MKKIQRRLTAVLAGAAAFMHTASGTVSAAYPTIDAQSKEYAEAVVALINRERLENGLEQLYIVPFMLDAADLRAQELSVSYGHTRPDGSSPTSVLLDEGFYYSYFGENNGSGQTTPARLADAWFTSGGHHATILDENFTREYTHVGVGYYLDETTGKTYWNMLVIGSFSSGEPYIYDDQYLPRLDWADADGSSVIDAKDATVILQYSAAKSAGLRSETVYSFEDAADVDKDGCINCIDAAIILRYTAAKGSGEDVTLEDFL